MPSCSACCGPLSVPPRHPQTRPKRGCPFPAPPYPSPTTSEPSPPPGLPLVPLAPASAPPRNPAPLGLLHELSLPREPCALAPSPTNFAAASRLNSSSCYCERFSSSARFPAVRRPSTSSLHRATVASRDRAAFRPDELQRMIFAVLRSYVCTPGRRRFVQRIPVRARKSSLRFFHFSTRSFLF